MSYFARNSLAVVIQQVALFFAILGLDVCRSPRVLAVKNDLNISRIAESKETLQDR